MGELDQTYTILLWTILGISAVTFPALFVITAPYGRHKGKWSGPSMNATLGWFIMELPPPIIFPIVFFQGAHAKDLVPLLLLCVWETHYCYRSFVYPFILSIKGKQKPIAAVGVGFGFNMINGFLNAFAIANLAPHLTTDWLLDPRFGLGLALMVVGVSINFNSDKILRNLRKPGETGYKIPNGGLYRWVSSPNYLGEIIEWGGFALASFTSAGLAFFLFTVANLFPRAVSHHKWYKTEFSDYPTQRKAILPGIV